MSQLQPTATHYPIKRYDNKHFSDSSEGTIEPPRSNTYMVQNVLLIWLDENINVNNDECQNTMRQLRRVVNTMKMFTDGDQCIQFLDSINGENVCMIVSGSLGQRIVPHIHNRPQVDSIFIFSHDKTWHEQWSKEWFKVKGIFNEIAPICKAVQQAAEECERNALLLASQVIKEISLTIQYERRHLKRFVKFGRAVFSDNDGELENLANLKRTYSTETPIGWYTSEPFLYPMLNRAMRKLDMEIFIKMGFFIGDLHRQLGQLHSEQLNRREIGGRMTFYRGQSMTKTLLDQMTKTKNGLLSFNNFLYASKDPNASLNFARLARKNSDLTGILFLITVDPSTSRSAFAYISKVSRDKYKEGDILFSMHTVFRVGNIKAMNEQNLYEVNLILANDNDRDLSILTDRIRQETFPQKEGWYRIASLLRKIGQLANAQYVYEILLQHTHNKNAKASIYGQLGVIKSDQGKHKDAITFYEKSLQIYGETLPANYPHMASSHSNIGNVYYQMGEYSKALASYEKAFEIQRKILPPNHPDLGLSYSSIGLMLGKMGQHAKAISFAENGLEIQRRSLPPNSPDLAASYNNIGALYDEMGQYSKALYYYENALAIRTQSVPPDYPALAIAYGNVGKVHQAMGEYSKALSYYEEGVNLQQQILPPNHPDLATSCNKLGGLCEDMGDFSQALSLYEQALAMRQQSLAPTHPSLGDSYNNIGNVHFNMDEYSKALSSYEKALEIREQSLPANDSGLSTSYNNIGAVHDKMGEYPKALSFYEKALAIRTQSLPPNHPDLALSHINIGVVYDKMGEYAKALSSYEKGIQIQQRSLPPTHPDLASSYNNLGAMYEDMRNYPQALTYYQKALAIRQQSLPPNHPDLLVSYNNIGVVYHQMRDFAKALSFYEAELKIQQESLPPNHPNLASSFSKIGALYEDMGNYTKARSFYGNAVHIARHSLPSNHPHLEMYKKNLNDVTKKL